jgi:hypothetical protein
MFIMMQLQKLLLAEKVVQWLKALIFNVKVKGSNPHTCNLLKLYYTKFLNL